MKKLSSAVFGIAFGLYAVFGLKSHALETGSAFSQVMNCSPTVNSPTVAGLKLNVFIGKDGLLNGANALIETSGPHPVHSELRVVSAWVSEVESRNGTITLLTRSQSPNAINVRFQLDDFNRLVSQISYTIPARLFGMNLDQSGTPLVCRAAF